VVGNYTDDRHTIDTFTSIVREQAAIGAREDAGTTVEVLLEYCKKIFESSNVHNARDATASKIAAALAAVGDFEGAFAWVEGIPSAGNVLGEIAEAASVSLNRIAARRFVREAAERLAKLEWADQTYFGLGDLAEAQARLGDLEGAKRAAKAIGEGPTRVKDDMTDGQPYALIRVAAVQHDAGDSAGARDTHRDAFRSVRDHPKMRWRDGRFSRIIHGQIANGDVDGAMQSLGAMSEVQAEILALIARAQAAAGELIAARATFIRALAEAGLSVKDPHSPNPELTKLPAVSPKMQLAERIQVAKIQAMAGDIAGALKTVQSDDEEYYRRSALQTVVLARATVGDVAGALRISLDESKTPEERRSALEGPGHGVDARLSLKSLEPCSK
jgi:hypothetical protein